MVQAVAHMVWRVGHGMGLGVRELHRYSLAIVDILDAG